MNLAANDDKIENGNNQLHIEVNTNFIENGNKTIKEYEHPWVIYINLRKKMVSFCRIIILL